MVGLENRAVAKAMFEQKAMDRIVSRLATDFHDVPSERIATVVRLEHALFQGSRVRDFVPILVERVVRRRLACGATHQVGDRHAQQLSGTKVRTNPECEPGRCWVCPQV